ncbi:MAG: AAA family ATPase, partial [Candidatus Rokubacteria bacterium]|nr:AAA family ATPase [Candidatus Rokubacteria bacterium]
RFCEECGARLDVACPICGQPVGLGKKFCRSCGVPLAAEAGRFASPQAYTPKHLAETILASRSALEGERKQVTVLFCDIANSTALAERLGPEAMHTLLNRFFELALAEVHRYEGTINQFLGDGFMALFGAPVAHEDHARRAILASLGIQRALGERGAELGQPDGVELAVRMGLNTGPVVVGKIGDNLRMDYTAVGDTTHLAARLQQLADPGAILVSEITSRLVQGYVRLEALAPAAVRGKTEPVSVYRVLGLGPRRSPLDVRWRRVLTSFVGRERELAALSDLLGQAERGQGQAVGIVGEAGLGKSRLVYEFRQSLADRRLTYLEGRCLSYGSGIPYLPVLDIIRSNCGITETDSPEAVGDKVRFALGEVGMDREAAAPYVLHLLGMKEGTERLEPLTPDVTKARTLETLRQLTVRGSQRRPIVFAVEDLHWIDRPSEEFFISLVESLPGARILLLMTYRPGYRPMWMDRSYATQLPLRPLAPEEGRSLVESLAEQRLEDAVTRVILDKGEGNPFFLEELTRAVLDEGGRPAARAVPDTIQDVLAARIDRLPEGPKRLLQTASVLGREVAPPLLEAIWDGPSLEAPLAELKRLEFLYEQTGPGEPTYVFKHALTQEVAYEGMLQERRKTLHARVVEAIEPLYADRLAQHVEALAYHAMRGEVWEKAVDYLREAGAKAFAKGALVESLERYEKALEIASRLPTTPENLRRAVDARLDLHFPLLPVGQIARLVEIHQEAEQIARQLDDQPRLGRLSFHMAAYSAWIAQYSRGIDYAQTALSIAAALDDAELRVMATHTLAVNYMALGDYGAVIDLVLRYVEGPDAALSKRRLGLTISPYVGGCSYLAWTFANTGDFERALTYGDHAVHAADDAGHPWAQVWAYVFRTTPPWLKGEFAEALQWCQRAAEICEQNGLLSLAPFAYSWLGWTLAWLGRTTEGLPYLERGAMLLEGMGIKIYLSLLHVWWAEGFLLAACLQEAKRAAGRALELATAAGERGIEADARRLLGEIAAGGDPPDVESATAFYEGAKALAQDLGMRPLLARCHLGLGRLLRRTAAQRPAYEHLTTAATMFGEMGMRFWLEQAEAQLRELG